MQYDFWNNPLVVSAMRLKYRRSSPGITTALYLLVLLTIGATLIHYQDSYNMPPGLAFLVVILGLQFIVSGATALFTVANSMNTEVLNRTFDFQRIVSLRPDEILLGKMLGEPAISYLLAVATIPFAMICWLVGSVSLTTIGWFYLNLATFTLFCAAIGSIHTLVPANNTSTWRRNNSGSIGMGLFWIPFMFFPMMAARGPGWLQDSWVGTILNLCTPIGSLHFLYHGQPWDAKLSLWGVELPSLVIAPLVQLALTYWIVTAMSRRVKNVLDPPLRRMHTYVALFLFDVIIAGTCFDQWGTGRSGMSLLAQFSMAHVIASLVLLFGIVPVKPVISSWLWRFEKQESWLKSSCFGSRSDITLVLPVYCALGAVAVTCGLVLPTYWVSSIANPPILVPELLEALLVSSVLIFGAGMLHQLCVVLAGKSGAMIYLIALLLLNIVPPILASIMVYPDMLQHAEGNARWIASLSPGAYFLLDMSSPPSKLPFVSLAIAQVVLFLVGHRVLKRWLLVQKATIAQKLKSMEADQDRGSGVAEMQHS